MGRAALRAAAEHGRKTVVECLLEAGGAAVVGVVTFAMGDKKREDRP